MGLVFCFFVTESVSQSNYFNKRYDFKDVNWYNNIEIANTIVSTNNGFIITGSSLKSSSGKIPQHPIAVLAIDKSGNPVNLEVLAIRIILIMLD